MTAKSNHRWNTKEYEERTKELNRSQLHKLYPSEAWALYRILPDCKNVLDLGCGNGAMAGIVKQISPKTKYTGMDHQETLMKNAKIEYPFANFSAGNLIDYIKNCGNFDCVMSWSVIKSFENWREIISLMIEKANKYVVVDIRVVNSDFEAFDDTVCWADYQGRRGPIVYVNYVTYKNALLNNKQKLSRIEIASYESEWGKYVKLKDGINTKTFLVVSVLKKRNSKNDNELEIFERLPENLIKI